MNDTERVLKEGPFYASMFVFLGAVVAFGGTIEVCMNALMSARTFSKFDVIQSNKLMNNSSEGCNLTLKHQLHVVETEVSCRVYVKRSISKLSHYNNRAITKYVPSCH